MSLPQQFHHTDPAIAQRLMREHPLASVVSVDAGGIPVLNHIPMPSKDLSHRANGLQFEQGVVWGRCILATAPALIHWNEDLGRVV
jgi:transcriptional regulator